MSGDPFVSAMQPVSPDLGWLMPPSRERCEKYDHHDIVNMRVIASNGISQIRGYCNYCNHVTLNLSHRMFKRDQIDDMPIHHDNRCHACNGTGCDWCSFHCEYIGCETPYSNVQRHHTAPHHRFADSNLWPCVYLCREHHMAWHRELTPAMWQTKAAS